MGRDEDPGASEAGSRELGAEAQELDRAIAAAGVDAWIGSEPTFTRRTSSEAAWTVAAIGADKEGTAHAMVALLARARPGGVVLRTLGRQYAGEARPRFSVGLLERRDGRVLWPGPPDPLLCSTPPPLPAVGALSGFAAAVVQAARERGMGGAVARVPGASRLGVALRADGTEPAIDGAIARRLRATPLHERPIPPEGLIDPLAREGLLVVAIGAEDLGGGGCAAVELPALDRVETLYALLAALAAAADGAGLEALILRGYPPPVDRTVAFTTLTPDPAVLEVNCAPEPDAAAFGRAMREVFAAARRVGLDPYRLQYDGTVVDSGGAGHLTIGGPAPRESPFFREPRLLPRLVRYLNRHPSLSYWFGPPYLGGSGQSPRADEGTREAFAELRVALERVERDPPRDPSLLARSLAPFLVDSSGNAHRSELNVEKLWNEALPGRGCLGLVEFRAFGMARSPAEALARACLLRAIVAMLALRDVEPELPRLGDELQDRYALPFYLRRDLDAVAADLAAAGFPLSPAMTAILASDEAREIGFASLDGCRVRIVRALEFWPLVGDVASQEAGASRLVDASTQRLEVELSLEAGAAHGLESFDLRAEGYSVPLREELGPGGRVRVGGLRHRAFTPERGLHPTIPASPDTHLHLVRRGANDALALVLHGWRPGGGAYEGLPLDLKDAARRRRERLVAQRVPVAQIAPARQPPAAAVTSHCLDLRLT